MSITIDKEFESLIPPLSPEEFQQLEENCVKEGIRDALITWNGILVDGHNRFKIAAKHGLHWNEKRMEFTDRNEVIRWIILNQFGRRNLSAYDRSVLALKLKPVIAEKAKEKQTETLKQNASVNQKSDERKEINTAKELANPCRPCLYYPICMERRGICTEYKTLAEVRKEIEMLNKEARTSATTKGDNEAGTR